MDDSRDGLRGRADRHRHPPCRRDRARADYQHRDRAPRPRRGSGWRRHREGAAQVLPGRAGGLRRDDGRRMSVILNEVRRPTYLDSIVLMRISRQIAALPGIEEAGLIIGTPANKEILRDAGILGPESDSAEPSDLILALRAGDALAGEAALAEAKRLIDHPLALGATAAVESSRTMRAAIKRLPAANLALISVPGDFAVAEAH